MRRYHKCGEVKCEEVEYEEVPQVWGGKDIHTLTWFNLSPLVAPFFFSVADFRWKAPLPPDDEPVL